MTMYDFLLVEIRNQAAKLDEDGIIRLDKVSDAEVEGFFFLVADDYIREKPADDIKEYAKEKLTKRFGGDHPRYPSLAPEKPKPKRITLTLSGKLLKPSDVGDLTLLERLTWEAQFGEHGKYYAIDADAGEAILVIPKGVNSIGADATLDNAWLWYDAASLVDFLNYTWGEALTPDFFRSIFPVPELLTDKVYQALMDSIKEAK